MLYEQKLSMVQSFSEMVNTVIIDGRTVLENKQLLVCDEREILQNAKTVAQHYWATVSEYHWAGETIEEQFPQSLKIWEETASKSQIEVSI